MVAKFEEILCVEMRKQEELDLAEKRNFRRGKLLEKYMVKILYRWDNEKFEKVYLKKLKRN